MPTEHQNQETPVSTGSMPESHAGLSPKQAVRRKLFRKAALVGLPVAGTVLSRPALAWHCRPPSAWGSITANTTTSMQAHHNANQYRDETWYASNWANNTGRGMVFGGTPPWDYLVNQVGLNFKAYCYALVGTGPACTACLTSSPGVGQCRTPGDSWVAPTFFVVLERSGSTPVTYLDLSKFRISDFAAVTGVAVPVGVDGAASVLSLLQGCGTSSWGALMLVAQLNYAYIDRINSSTDISSCITGVMDLRQVATSGSYTTTNGMVWGQQTILRYLQENWIAVP